MGEVQEKDGVGENGAMREFKVGGKGRGMCRTLMLNVLVSSVYSFSSFFHSKN